MLGAVLNIPHKLYCLCQILPANSYVCSFFYVVLFSLLTINIPKAKAGQKAIHYEPVTGHLIAAQMLIIFPFKAELGMEKQSALRAVL